MKLNPRIDPTDPATLEQIEWERSSVTRGIERYRQSLQKTHEDGRVESRSLADLEPGQRIISDIMPGLTEGISALQGDAAKGLATSFTVGGRPSPWWWPIISIPADEMALITLRTVLSSPTANPGRSVRSLSLEIGRNVKMQFEYRLWKDAEKAAEKEGALNYWKLMMKRSKTLDERAFKKFAKRSGRLDIVNWTFNVRVHLGMALLDALVRGSGGWFEMRPVQTRWGRRMTTERVLLMSEAGKRWVEHRHETNELARPWLLPMLTPPLDWEEVPEADDEQLFTQETTHEDGSDRD